MSSELSMNVVAGACKAPPLPSPLLQRRRGRRPLRSRRSGLQCAKVRFGFGAALLAFICALPLVAAAVEDWQGALVGMPLRTQITELNRTNCVEMMLQSFQSNEVVKALIFMPGATDEFYMFHRAKARLMNPNPSLLDAVAALTNQTLIRATFHPPLLLLHTDEDPLEPLIRIVHQPTAEKLRGRNFPPHVLYDDRDWDVLQPVLKKALKMDVRPWRYSYDTYHFYRHSLAGWGLNGWEALEAIALAGKTTVRVENRRLIFEGDERVRATPKLDVFPK